MILKTMNRPVDFGNYRLLERLNVGGMAEVFKAKMYGVEGFERLVAVKRILPSIAEDTEFITMFIDEAKIAVQLNHANIAQIFDLGKVGDSFYIAMEYVAGKDLRAVFDKQRALNRPMPHAVACAIMLRVCEGLDYAHNKRGADGRHLALVHRDVSPQNILVSFDGDVKVIDFGIAKAAGKAGKTRSGILKGKFSYMSPEQSRGLPLDRRSDLFTAAICFYELVTGERLFLGETDISTVEKVRNVEVVPPRQHVPSLPRRLEQILLKALARRPEDRFQDAMELHDAILGFMTEEGVRTNQRDIREYIQRTFSREIAKQNGGISEQWGADTGDSIVSTTRRDEFDDDLRTRGSFEPKARPPEPPPVAVAPQQARRSHERPLPTKRPPAHASDRPLSPVYTIADPHAHHDRRAAAAFDDSDVQGPIASSAVAPASSWADTPDQPSGLEPRGAGRWSDSAAPVSHRQAPPPHAAVPAWQGAPLERPPVASARALEAPTRHASAGPNQPIAHAAGQPHVSHGHHSGQGQPVPGLMHQGNAAVDLNAGWDVDDFPTEEFRPRHISGLQARGYPEPSPTPQAPRSLGGHYESDFDSSRRAQSGSGSRPRISDRDQSSFLFDDASEDFIPATYERASGQAPSGSQRRPQGESFSSRSRSQGTPSPFEIDSVPGKRVSGVTAVTEYLTRRRSRIGFVIMFALGWGLLLLMGISLWSIYGQRAGSTIQLVAKPAGAEVSVDGKVVTGQDGAFAIRDITPGATHEVKVSKPGFEPWTGSVTVGAGETLTLPPITLEPAKGIAHQELGTGGGPTGFVLNTEPPGAKVNLDGVWLDGVTPIRVSGVPAGKHVVQLSLPGATQQKRLSFELSAGEILELETVSLDPVAARLTVDSKPRGVEVWLLQAGKPRRMLGKTPLTEAGIDPTLATALRIEAKGYKPWQKSVSLDQTSGDVSVMADLVAVNNNEAVRPPPPARPKATPRRSRARQTPPARSRAAAPRSRAAIGEGTLRINSRPWAEVSIDGRNVGNTPLMNLKLSAGSHRITLRNPDFSLEKTIRVEIAPGETVTKVVRLGE